MGESGDLNERFLRAKKAFEKNRESQQTLEQIREDKERAQALMYLGGQVLMYQGGHRYKAEQGGDRRAMEAMDRAIAETEDSIREAEEDWRRADALEREALRRSESIAEELRDATVEQRAEGLKLQFETRKLQATLSAGVVLGTATITELLLPPNPSYVFLLWATYAAFLVSLYGSLSDMQRISIYVENVLISGRRADDEGFREKVINVVMKVNQQSLSVGVLLFIFFVTLNLTR